MIAESDGERLGTRVAGRSCTEDVESTRTTRTPARTWRMRDAS